MLCERCKERPATVHISKIINNKQQDEHLCQVCAGELGYFQFGGLDFSWPQLFPKLVNWEEEKSAPEQCPQCGLTFRAFSQKGKAGCAGCYSAFAKQLDPLFLRIHTSNRHKGKLPFHQEGQLAKKRELDQLKIKLSQLVADQDFEEAAMVRDEIRALEKNGEGGSADGQQ